MLQHFHWDLTHQVLFLYILPSHHVNLWETSIEDWKMLVRWCRTDICSCKLSAKVSLMLDNPFLVPSLCKLNHINVCFIQISTKSPGNSLFPSGKAIFFFWSHPQCFGPLGKVQHNINISIKTSSVSRLSVSYDYGLTKLLPPMTSIWLNYINSFWLFRNCINCINRVSLWENT